MAVTDKFEVSTSPGAHSAPVKHSGSPGWYSAHWQNPHSEHTGSVGGQSVSEPQAPPPPAPPPWPQQSDPPGKTVILVFNISTKVYEQNIPV